MQRWWLSSCGYIAAGWLVGVSFLAAPAAQAQQAEIEPADTAAPAAAAPVESAAPADPAAPATAAAPVESAATDSLGSDFSNFLQFAIIGRFDYAQAHAQSLLGRPDVSPLSKEAADTLYLLCQQRPGAIDTLVALVSNSTIGEDSGKILGLIREAYRFRRMDPKQIVEHIGMLKGTPTEQATGMERLIDSGEYAVPHMLSVLADPRQKELHAYVARALPRLGKPAVNPLVAALSINDDLLQRFVADALGRLGYPQALPYLKRLADGAKANPVARQTAVEAIRQIVIADPQVKDAPVAQLFEELAEGYYAELQSLASDRNLPRANVWVPDGDTVKALDVPRQIFCLVTCMQACKASLALNKDQPRVLALWLAANFRRESRLGLDVQSLQAANVDDPTQPAEFPRSIYFARAAGAQCCGLVLERGLKDKDRSVVLGAIAGMAASAGPEVVAGLAEAVRFPDQLVRIRAGLVLGRILPSQSFAGDNEVVPVLASAFSIAGQKNYLVVDPDEKTAEAVVADLTKSGAKVVSATQIELGLARAAKQTNHLDGVFMASDVANPGAVDAVRVLGHDEKFGLAPVVLYVKEGGVLVADQVVESDWRVGRVLVVDAKSPAELLLAKLPQVDANFGYRSLTAEDGVALSIEAARGLQRIAANESKVFDARACELALIQALNSHASEEVRIATTRVLALLNTRTAQPAIAAVALSDKQTPTLRTAAFASLAESARRFGNHLGDVLAKELIRQAMSEANLDLRTAASQALGATIQMPAELAVEAILNGAKGG